ncbi:MAG: ribose 5-phosphate isomerase B, partial [Nanoarchaeota archaeon]|nr:ribose 5-phosphate isomerase B [Nanoarchaeota archaeon]
MKVIIGSDHGGFELKQKIKKYLDSKEIQTDDVGVKDNVSCDYPDYAAAVAKRVQETKELGIIICGTGIGVCMTANKFRGIRAALCYDKYTAKMAREHNNANILCIGGRTTKERMAKKIVDIFLNTQASTEERHKKRLEKI